MTKKELKQIDLDFEEIKVSVMNEVIKKAVMDMVSAMQTMAHALLNKQEFTNLLKIMYDDPSVDNKKIVTLCETIDKVEAKNIGSISVSHDANYKFINVYFYIDDTTLNLERE